MNKEGTFMSVEDAFFWMVNCSDARKWADNEVTTLEASMKRFVQEKGSHCMFPDGMILQLPFDARKSVESLQEIFRNSDKELTESVLIELYMQLCNHFENHVLPYRFRSIFPWGYRIMLLFNSKLDEGLICAAKERDSKKIKEIFFEQGLEKTKAHVNHISL